MQLKVNEVYKYLEGEDLELDKDYSYWICIGNKDDYFILNEFEQYCKHNGLSDQLEAVEDLDEEFKNNPELNISYSKKLNSLEMLYYDTKVEQPKSTTVKRKFVKV
jgi:hypothetical protein